MRNKANTNSKINISTLDLEKELEREIYKSKCRTIIKNTFYKFVVVIAFSVLESNFLLPTFKIYGSSMAPTLKGGDIVLGLKKSNFKRGDVIAFYHNNHILIKRVIALSNEWVDIDEDGNVFIDGILLEESYLDKKALGNTDIIFPYQVPDGSYFVLGDKREISIDSRDSRVKTINHNDIIGKVLIKIWPIKNINIV